MKVSVRRILFIILVVLWMGVIFFMSSRDAETSSRESYYVGMQIGSVLHADFEDWTPEEQLSYAERIDYPVRKTAHFTEFAVLGLLLTGALLEPGRKWNIKTGGKALLIAVLYALTDEFHQRFVPGRSCELTDVLIDGSGAAFGILFSALVLRARILAGKVPG